MQIAANFCGMLEIFTGFVANFLSCCTWGCSPIRTLTCATSVHERFAVLSLAVPLWLGQWVRLTGWVTCIASETQSPSRPVTQPFSWFKYEALCLCCDVSGFRVQRSRVQYQRRSSVLIELWHSFRAVTTANEVWNVFISCTIWRHAFVQTSNTSMIV
jgi:hypothetical protein